MIESIVILGINDWDRCGKDWRFQLYSGGGFQSQLVLDVTNNVLVGGTALPEGLQFVHVAHVPPQGGEFRWYLEFAEGLSADADMLQTRHQLTIEAGHCIPCEESCVPFGHKIVDSFQMRQQGLTRLFSVARLEFRHVHFEFGVKIFD